METSFAIPAVPEGDLTMGQKLAKLAISYTQVPNPAINYSISVLESA